MAGSYSEEPFRLTFEHAPTGLAVVGLDGAIEHANHAFCELLGRTSAPPFGHPLLEIVHPDDRVADHELRERLVRTSIPRCNTVERYLRQDGTAVEVYVHLSLVRDDDGRPSRYLLQVEAMDARRRIPQATFELERRVARTERLATLGTLAAGMAHEINNPLASVLANLGYVLELIDRARAPVAAVDNAALLCAMRDALVDANDGAERVAKIMEGLRRFANSEGSGEVPMDVQGALESALDLTTHAFGQHVVVERAYGPTPPVRANQSQLNQLFVNLLLNAVEAIERTSTTRAVVRIVCGREPTGGAFVEVHDSGRGIPASDLPRVFDPFFTTKRSGNTGLGLAVCHSIVSSMGGELAVQSEAGKGSVFRVRFPESSDHDPIGQSLTSGMPGAVLVVE